MKVGRGNERNVWHEVQHSLWPLRFNQRKKGYNLVLRITNNLYAKRPEKRRKPRDNLPLGRSSCKVRKKECFLLSQLKHSLQQSLFYVKGNRGWANDKRQEARRRGSRVWFLILRAPPAILEVKSRLFAVQLKYGVARNQQTVCREMLKCTILWFHGAKNCVQRGGG